jgi:hypothetical protein
VHGRFAGCFLTQVERPAEPDADAAPDADAWLQVLQLSANRGSSQDTWDA